MEMTGIARKIMAKTFAPVEAFIAAGILYLLVSFLNKFTSLHTKSIVNPTS